MNNIKKAIMWVCILMISSLPLLANSQSISERRIELDPIQMTYKDLSGVLSNLELLIKSANKNVPSSKYDKEYISISISSEQDTMRVSEWGKLHEMNFLPTVGYSVRFSYLYSDAPISSVSLTLGDSMRVLKVSGTDYTQVNAISLALRSSLEGYTTKLGGRGFRAFCMMVFVVLTMSVVYLLSHDSKSFLMIQVASIVVVNVIIIMPPWDKWISGFSIYLDSASFIDRNINELAFLGVAVSILTPLAGAGIKKIQKKNNT
ncbi:MAG: hypothetical protein COA76_05420 [Moritella sp.]|nr:MAG: hypothetical protein COA76_05420 [Moritella sp.]